MLWQVAYDSASTFFTGCLSLRSGKYSCALVHGGESVPPEDETSNSRGNENVYNVDQ